MRLILLAVMTALIASGCAAEAERKRPVVYATPTAAPTSAPLAEARTNAAARPRRRDTPRKVVATPTAAPAQFVRCDGNITVRAATTSCGLAQNVFYAFFMDADEFEPTNKIRAYSPASREHYELSCKTSAAERVRCVASDGSEVRFDLTAMLDYDDEQAARYARTHDLGPGADDAGEDYGSSPYDDDYSPPDLDLGYGDEIPNYDEGRGYRVQCADGMYSKSGGIQGACSGHGGLADGPASSGSSPSYDPPSPSSGGTVHVRGYYRKDGTYVRPHTRRAPCSYC